VSAEEDLLRRLRAALAGSDVDAQALIGEAWQEANDQVRAVLVRAFTHDLLARVVEEFEHETSRPTARPPTAETPPTGMPPTGMPPTGMPPTGMPPTGTPPTGIPEPAGGAGPGGADAAAGTDHTVTYVFGVTRAEGPVPGPPGSTALPGGGPVRALDVGELRALVCDLDATTMAALGGSDPDGLEVLATAAVAHDDVLVAAAARQTVLPLRLGTMVEDDAAARAVLQRHHDALHAELDRLDGHAEWAVTVRSAAVDDATPTSTAADPRATDAGTTDAGTTGAGAGESTDGRGYLQSRQRDLSARQRRREARRTAAADIHARLAVHATASETGDRERAGGSDTALLHDFHLVSAASAPAFLATVDEVRGQHPALLVEVSGPLPPYHFVRFEESFDR